tara:strand:- start:2827 stop:3048 length:222 start_codon:yes stop_codon:yes gene_type:complete
MIENINKFSKAINNLKANVEWTYNANNELNSEEEFNKILWNIGVDDNGSAIQSTTCPHSEITWTKVKAEMDKL